MAKLVKFKLRYRVVKLKADKTDVDVIPQFVNAPVIGAVENNFSDIDKAVHTKDNMNELHKTDLYGIEITMTSITM
jgi:hypothetical protein